ncbi:MAG: type II secretion system major pseudopilin GspG, partial [Pseudobdellovibrionaceae bacterium]
MMRAQIANRRIYNNRGMTLVEIMIVLAIIGGLMAVLLPQVTGQMDKARVKETQIEMARLIDALNRYNIDCGAFPSSIEGLVTAAGDECPNWGPDPYIKKVPKDAWNKDYVYSADASGFVLKSLGKDGKEGGSAYDKDLDS